MPLYTLFTYVSQFNNRVHFEAFRNIFIYIGSTSRLPWNDDTLTGWLFGWLSSLWMALTYFFINCIFLSFFLSTRFTFGAVQRQFDVIMQQINETNAMKADFNRRAKEVMHQSIRLHNLVKR